MRKRMRVSVTMKERDEREVIRRVKSETVLEMEVVD